MVANYDSKKIQAAIQMLNSFDGINDSLSSNIKNVRKELLSLLDAAQENGGEYLYPRYPLQCMRLNE